jgi:sporadic carbohydrate cluster protein (TIGR04323 family)
MKEFSGYVTVRSFDGMNIPITLQHNTMRKYCDELNAIYKLAQTELVVKSSSFVLFSVLKKIKNNGNLVMCSIFMLPESYICRNKILNYVKKKKVKIHFVFENFIVRDEKSFFEMENLLSLKSYINNHNPQEYLEFFKSFQSIN